MFSSVHKPWDSKKYCASHVWYSYRPYASAWILALKNNSGEPTPIDATIYRELFAARNPADPIGETAGLGLSFKEVACEWLTLPPDGHADYKNYHPCHFSFYDPGASTATLINNEARWVGADGTSVATYNGASSAVAWFPPDLTETRDKRPANDPDIFSWQIPHLRYVSCSAETQPRSSETGKAVTVYFANLTDSSVQVKRIMPGGSTVPVTTLATWTSVTSGRGAIQYPTGNSSQAMEGVRSWVGAAYRVFANGKCMGAYVVKAPPKHAGSDQVAEIHAHNNAAGSVLHP
jgi:hypothetical protein